jgi:dihydrofolate reductase
VNTRPLVTLIAAVSDDGFISRGKGVPWNLPADRAHFRAHTAAKWLLIGRSTYEEMLGWFQPAHHPLVLSRDMGFKPGIGQRVSSANEALDLAAMHGAEELVVCGGAQCYLEAIPLATRLLLTRVHTTLGTGVEFPAIDPTEWKEISRNEHRADSSHAFALTFLELERAKGSVI